MTLFRAKAGPVGVEAGALPYSQATAMGNDGSYEFADMQASGPYDQQQQRQPPVSYPNRDSLRTTTCGNWITANIKIQLALSILLALVCIATFIVVIIILADSNSKINDIREDMKHMRIEMEQTFWCTMNNACETMGMTEACDLRHSIEQCGLGLSRGATSGVTQYFSQFTPDSSAPSPTSGTPGSSLL